MNGLDTNYLEVSEKSFCHTFPSSSVTDTVIGMAFALSVPVYTTRVETVPTLPAGSLLKYNVSFRIDRFSSLEEILTSRFLKSSLPVFSTLNLRVTWVFDGSVEYGVVLTS